MCGRYASFTRLDERPGLFDLDVVSPDVSEKRESYNVAPTTDVPIIIERVTDDNNVSREAHLAHWGLVPIWAKDTSIGARMINARIETVAEKKSFAPSLAKKRCIVPADGYFEWKKTPDGKQPFYIQRDDHELLAFAGLYSWWKSEDGWLLSTTIMTRQASQLSDIHDREPVILDHHQFSAWLDPAMTDPFTALEVLQPPNPRLRATEVSRLVGSVRNNDPSLIQPLDVGRDPDQS